MTRSMKFDQSISNKDVFIPKSLAALLRPEFRTLPHTRRGIKAEGRWFGPFASSPK